MKRASLVLFGVLGLCLPVVAQEVGTGAARDFYRTNYFRTVDASVLIGGLPVSSLLDGRAFPISSSLGRMGTASLDVAPLAYLNAAPARKSPVAPVYETDEPDGVVNLRSNPLYFGGEIGFAYGKSTGKYGGEVLSSYFVGTVGNDKVQVTAGASYEESTVRFPRYAR